MDAAEKNGKIYDFDEFRLIPEEDLLLRNGEPVPLNPKAFRVLALLLERNGHLVQKSEILDRVWQDSFVEEGSLSKAIWFVRTALSDTSKEKFIQTVPRRGYRFVSPVTVVSNSSGAFRLEDLHALDKREGVFPLGPIPATNGFSGRVSVTTNSSSLTGPAADRAEELSELAGGREKSSSLFPRWGMLAGLVAIVVITASLGYYGFVLKSSDGSPRSIVVLPVAPINIADRNVLYEIGIAESLINRLSSAEGLIVRPLSAVRSYVDIPKDPIAMGLEQKADYVLASNYQIADGKIKVSAQLYNVRSGMVEAAPQIQMAATDVFAIQDSVGSDFGNRLMQRLGVSSSRPVKTLGTNNKEAYRLFINARQQYHQLGTFRERRERSTVDLLKEAVALDPNFADAWATLAIVYTGRSTAFRFADGTERQGAMDAIKRAIAIDPNLSEAYSAKCFAETHFEFDRDAAETACRRALDLDPNSGDAHRYYAAVLTTLGRHEEAISEMKTAIDLEPKSASYQRIFGNLLYYARRFDEAAAQYKGCIGLEPNDPNNYESLIKTLELQGKDLEAFEYLIKLVTVQGKDETTIESLRTAYAEAGYRGVLLERIRTSDGVFGVAGMYARLGDKNMAFEWLEKAYERHSWQLIFLETDPQFDLLREDPRFHDLIWRIQANDPKSEQISQ